MTFDPAWVSQLDDPFIRLRTALGVGLESFGEFYTLYDQYDNIVIIELISDRDVEAVVYIVAESLSMSFPSIRESDFDIEIDLNVPFDVIDWDEY